MACFSQSKTLCEGNYRKEGKVFLDENINDSDVLKIDKENLIAILTEELPVLRAKLGLSQEELSEIIGISRQTYSGIETKRRPMTWNTFLSLVFVYSQNEKTVDMLKNCGAFPETLRQTLNVNNRKDEKTWDNK